MLDPLADSLADSLADPSTDTENTQDLPRPITWGECLERGLGTHENPCWYVGCKWHFALDRGTGGDFRVVTPFVSHPSADVPEIDIAAMPHTCTLRVADEGGTDLATCGAAIGGFVPERARQIEALALEKLYHRDGARMAAQEIDIPVPREGVPRRLPTHGHYGKRFRQRTALDELLDDEPEDAPPVEADTAEVTLDDPDIKRAALARMRRLDAAARVDDSTD